MQNEQDNHAGGANGAPDFAGVEGFVDGDEVEEEQDAHAPDAHPQRKSATNDAARRGPPNAKKKGSPCSCAESTHAQRALTHRVEQLLLFRVKTCFGRNFGACARPETREGGSNAGRGDTKTRGGLFLRRKT